MEIEGEDMIFGNIVKVFFKLFKEDWRVGRGLDL